MIDEQQIRCWWSLFKQASPLTEIRIIGNNKTFSGYYTDVEKLLCDIRAFDGYGIYATINAVKEPCYSRVQHDCIIQKPKETTSDNDIDFRSTILIDIDPIRASGVNASDAEKQRALLKTREIYSFLADQGFEKPVVADSANGYHLYYRVCVANSPEATALFKRFLDALDMLFSEDEDGGAKVDTSVFNASRIAKVIGTASNKGSSTKARPKRSSRFLSIPDEFKTTDIAYIRKVAEMLPEPEKPSRYNNYNPERFDVRSFISEHGIEVVRESKFAGGVKFILKECPFDHNHKDAAIFLLDNGAVAFKCFHASCQQYHWRDFRLHYDPQAYDRRALEEFDRKRRYNAQVRQEDIKPVAEDSRGHKWMKASDFKFFDLKDAQAIPIGIPAIDRKTMGLILGEVTVLTGGSGAGKTTFLNHLILTATQRNYRTALWTGEMSGGRVVAWIDQMAAGKSNVELVPGTDGLYSVPKRYRDKINEWLGDRLWIYNNAYGQKWSQLASDIESVISKHGVNLVLLDNLMCIDLDNLSGEMNERQKAFINTLTDLAKRTNTHIVLVAHPRKENLTQLIRKESISGSGDITNLAFNVILLHRVGRDFEKRGKEFFGPTVVADLMNYSLVVEVNKARTSGCQDLLVGLHYEPETRRLKNDIAENVIYGWDDKPVQQSLDDLPPDDLPEPNYTDNF